ncbi:MAG: lysylphosphatidylglycerol synthase transmembrane domain-containing protein [Elusimicrobiota bacterium]
MKNIYKYFIKLFGIIIFSYILIKTDWIELKKVFLNTDILSLLPIYFLIVPNDLINSFRWHYILNSLGIKRKYLNNVKLFLSGFLAGIITPGRIGEFYKLFRIKKEGYSPLKGALSIGLMKLLNIFILFFMSIPAIFIIGIKRNYNSGMILKNSLLASAFFLFLIFISLIFKKKTAQFISLILIRFFKTDVKEDALFKQLKKFNLSFILILLFLTIVRWSIFFSQIYFIAIIIGIKVPFFTMYFILALVTLISSLPITVMGIGTREAALIFSLSVFNITKEKSLALSLFIYTIFILNVIIATIFWHIEHKDL